MDIIGAAAKLLGIKSGGVAPSGAAPAAPSFDPHVGFRFIVEIDGIYSGGFQEVSGLSVEMEVESHEEGGVNDYVHKLPKRVKYSDLSFKKGLLDLNATRDWFLGIAAGKSVVRKSGSIRLIDRSDNKKVLHSWDFFDAYPIKWEVSGINAGTAGVVTENIVLAHHGLKKA